MATKAYNTIVIMPDNSRLEVTYYCKDSKPGTSTKEKQTQLFIQLHDCICHVSIEKSLCKKPEALEKIVHNKVIHTRGHLC
jgi:hypothetical protein